MPDPATPARASRSRRLIRGAVATLVACLAAGLAPAAEPGAAPRALSWPEIRVEARLDAEGRLHVRERQTLRFDGDWNGGERRIHLRPFQKLDVEAVSRIPDGTGRAIRLTRGDLDRVDHWDLVDGEVIRWRARDAEAPVFDDTVLTYRLDYTLSGVLTPVEGREATYLLDHEFGFGVRGGMIDRLTVELTLDPAWRRLDAGAATYRESWTDLSPYRSPVSRLELRHLPQAGGGAPPGGVVRPLSRSLMAVPFLLALAVMTWLALRFAFAVRRWPRVEPLADLGRRPTREWLQEHVLGRPAEEVGALWDRSVGEPEVTALLARLVAEGKLRSWTEPPKDSEGRPKAKGKPVLHLQLLVPRESLQEVERDLVDGLFVRGDVTDTALVRRHYTGKGFDPAALLRPSLEARLPPEEAAERPEPVALKRWSWALLILAVACLGYTAVAVHSGLALYGFGAAMLSAMTTSLCLGLAATWRHRVDWPAAAALGFVLPLFAVELFLAVLTFALARSGMPNPGLALLPILGTVALLPAASLAGVLHHATSRESRPTVHLRRRLGHARKHFAAELRRGEPDLEDRWMPYLLAFGLASRVDRWSDRWSVASPVQRPGAFGSGASGASAGDGGGSWSGGGGAFGGAGATAGWAAAAAGMAGGVSAPSGSGGGGGGGGGGGSGGGGGGGW